MKQASEKTPLIQRSNPHIIHKSTENYMHVCRRTSLIVHHVLASLNQLVPHSTMSHVKYYCMNVAVEKHYATIRLFGW